MFKLLHTIGKMPMASAAFEYFAVNSSSLQQVVLFKTELGKVIAPTLLRGATQDPFSRKAARPTC